MTKMTTIPVNYNNIRAEIVELLGNKVAGQFFIERYPVEAALLIHLSLTPVNYSQFTAWPNLGNPIFLAQKCLDMKLLAPLVLCHT